jgi:hypothetical protein
MSALENSIYIKILKETTIFLTHLILKILCCTPFGVLRFENH